MYVYTFLLVSSVLFVCFIDKNQDVIAKFVRSRRDEEAIATFIPCTAILPRPRFRGGHAITSCLQGWEGERTREREIERERAQRYEILP